MTTSTFSINNFNLLLSEMRKLAGLGNARMRPFTILFSNYFSGQMFGIFKFNLTGNLERKVGFVRQPGWLLGTALAAVACGLANIAHIAICCGYSK